MLKNSSQAIMLEIENLHRRYRLSDEDEEKDTELDEDKELDEEEAEENEDDELSSKPEEE